MAMTREQAWDLLSKYNKEPFHLRHAITCLLYTSDAADD